MWLILNFNGLSPVGSQFASQFQISSKSVKRLLIYGDLTVFFKMAAVRHLGFVDERSEVSFSIPRKRCPWQPIFVRFTSSVHRIGFPWHSVDGGVRQEVQVLCCMQANQLTNRRLGGYGAV